MVDPFAIRRSAAGDVVIQRLNRKFREIGDKVAEKVRSDVSEAVVSLIASFMKYVVSLMYYEVVPEMVSVLVRLNIIDEFIPLGTGNVADEDNVGWGE